MQDETRGLNDFLEDFKGLSLEDACNCCFNLLESIEYEEEHYVKEETRREIND